MWASTGPHNGRGLSVAAGASTTSSTRRWKRPLAESADAYAHHQAPQTINDADDELQRALKASADGFADEQRHWKCPRAAAARRRPQRRSTMRSQRRSTTRPTCLLPSRAGPSRTSRALTNDAAHVDDDLARALAASRAAEDGRRAPPRPRGRRGAAPRGAPRGAAPPAMPAPPGPAARVRRSAAPPGLPPGLAGFPAAPKLPRDPLAAFLDGAGMGRYLGLFRDEEIRTAPGLSFNDGPGPPRHRPPAATPPCSTSARRRTYLANGL